MIRSIDHHWEICRPCVRGSSLGDTCINKVDLDAADACNASCDEYRCIGATDRTNQQRAPIARAAQSMIDLVDSLNGRPGRRVERNGMRETDGRGLPNTHKNAWEIHAENGGMANRETMER